MIDGIDVPVVLRGGGSDDFFDAAGRGQLLLRRCIDCAAHRGPQEPVCPHCGATQHDPVPAAGTATLVSWSVVHRSPVPGLPAPYVAGLVEVTEGPWLLTRVLTAPHEALHAGMPLRIEVAAPAAPEAEAVVLAATSAWVAARTGAVHP